ncbi:O-antigen ligase family protein, partial [Candidatus Kapabacteria bacterium]|nr:O-antigen ligase family protein [Candidatus Kapabacteria bacterium]
ITFLSLAKPLFDGSDGQILQFFKTFLHLAYLMIFALTAFTGVIENKHIFKVLKILLFLSIFVNLFAFYQLVARVYDLPFSWIVLNSNNLHERVTESDGYEQFALKYENFYRGTSIFSEPSALASFNLMMLSFLLPQLDSNSKFLKSFKYIVFLVLLSVLTLFITFSLTALVGLAFLFVTTFFLGSRKFRITFFKVIGVGTALLLIADFFTADFVGISVFELFADRVLGIIEAIVKGQGSGISGESFFLRVSTLFSGFDIFLDNHFFGVGLGLYGYNNSLYMFPDSGLPQIIAETGLFGTIFFYLIIFTTVYLNLHLIKVNSKKHFLDNSEILLLKIGITTLAYLFFIVSFTGNIFISSGLWLPIFIPFAILYNTYFKYKKHKIIFTYREQTIASKFATKLNHQLNN